MNVLFEALSKVRRRHPKFQLGEILYCCPDMYKTGVADKLFYMDDDAVLEAIRKTYPECFGRKNKT